MKNGKLTDTEDQDDTHVLSHLSHIRVDHPEGSCKQEYINAEADPLVSVEELFL